MGKRWFEPLAHFFGHTIVATGIFFCIFIAAGLIDYCVHLADGKVSKWLEYAAESVAIFIVALDLIAFGLVHDQEFSGLRDAGLTCQKLTRTIWTNLSTSENSLHPSPKPPRRRRGGISSRLCLAIG